MLDILYRRAHSISVELPTRGLGSYSSAKAFFSLVDIIYISPRIFKRVMTELKRDNSSPETAVMMQRRKFSEPRWGSRRSMSRTDHSAWSEAPGSYLESQQIYVVAYSENSFAKMHSTAYLQLHFEGCLWQHLPSPFLSASLYLAREKG